MHLKSLAEPVEAKIAFDKLRLRTIRPNKLMLTAKCKIYSALKVGLQPTTPVTNRLGAKKENSYSIKLLNSHS